MKRLIITIVLVLMAIFVVKIAELAIFPVESAKLAVGQLEDSDVSFQEMQIFEWFKTKFTLIVVNVTGLIFLLIWYKPIKRVLKGEGPMKRLMLMVLMISLMVSVTGCRRPVDVPEYEVIRNNETAFVIPLEGDVSAQAKFSSEAYLKSLQVATKRIRILHRWNQTGRDWKRWAGEWIPLVTILTVNRAPVTRQWTAEAATGTGNVDQAIWVESKDSVGFSIGFSCTAYIEEEFAALFLYKYTSSSLANIMDSEIRARVQSVAAETCGKYDLDELRSKKDEVIKAVREDVIPFFAARGITVTTIGMFGGFKYENEKVQEAIDEVFRSQQLEDVEEAKRKASLITKETIMILADAEAQRINKIAEAEAGKIEKIAAAAESAQKNPLFLSLRQLEVEQDRIEKWDGSYPRWYMGEGLAGSSPNILLGIDESVVESN